MNEITDAERRVWARLPAGAAAAIGGLSGSDLQVLMMGIARERAHRVRPAQVLRRWRQDRLVRPAAADPRAVAALEARLWAMLPADVDGVFLSPVVPLGTCTSVAPQSPNRIVTTTRPVEVLSDPTNALAVEAADRRSRQGAGGEVHLAATHQILRAQHFGPGRGSHFRLFSLVSSARDTGSGRTEARLLARHLAFWRQILPEVGGTVVHTVFDDPVLRERLAGMLPEDPGRQRGRGYYTGAALLMTAGGGLERGGAAGAPHGGNDAAERGGGAVELGDGGFTTWTAQLLGDAKERCLVSCLSTERMAALLAG
ncbi:hypothetical protein ACQP2F_24110 [Actinoplanes sp. CA-030573]|uniref:hypothetical protein n=1 Tax=Actinoplanes sp. CA-030573 TaxID=3239898 RepID=UPI003D92009F